MNLAKRLAEEAEYDFNYLDTIAWVKLKCNDSSSDEYAAGKDILQSLLKRGDATDYGVAMLKKKYAAPLGLADAPED